MSEAFSSCSSILLGHKVQNDQLAARHFELWIKGRKRDELSSASTAREKLIAVIRQQSDMSDVEARKEMTQLGKWKIETLLPGHPED